MNNGKSDDMMDFTDSGEVDNETSYQAEGVCPYRYI